MRVLTYLALAVGVTALAACNTTGASGPPSNAPTPTGPQRTITGQVREVNGGPLADVAITAFSGRTGQSTGRLPSTAADGSFRIDQFAYDDLQFFENGYWPRGWSVPQGAKLDATFTFTMKIQPMLRVSPGSTIASVLTPDDLTYSSNPSDSSEDGIGDWATNLLCGPCKLIYASVPQTGGTFRLSWSGETPLTLWAGDSYAASNSGPIAVAIGKPGESELIVPVPAGTGVDTVLVGFDRKKGSSPIT